VDGKLIEDTSVIMKLNPKDIEKIEVLRNSNNKYDHGFYGYNYIVITTKRNKKANAKFNQGKQILISSGQFSPSTEITINNYKFDLVKNNNDTLYLSTKEEGFTTPEGYRVGVKFSDIPDDLIQKLKKETGWGYYIKLPSNWYLGFCEGSSCTDKPPGSSSKIKWIFKRNKSNLKLKT
jgi:hypothetical protein